MMETESSYDHQQLEPPQQPTQRTKNKAGQFGRPLIPFFLNEDANGETPTGGYSVNEDLFLTDEQAQQQERVFVPRGEKSIRVREFKDGYFEYKDLSFDAIQEKLTFHSPIKQQQQQQANNSNQAAQFFSQHENSKNTNSNAGNPSGNGRGSKTSSRDHFANYERMVIPFQHKNNMAKSNDNSSSSDENKRQSDEDKREEEDEKQKKRKQKKKVMVPVNVQKHVSTRNTTLRNHENQQSTIVSNQQEAFVSSLQNYPIQQQLPMIPTNVNHGVVYPQPMVIHNNLVYPPSPTYPKPVTNHQLLTPSLFGITRSSNNLPNNSSYSPNPSSSSSSSGLLKPSALFSQSPSLKSPASTIPQQVPTQHHHHQLPTHSTYDVSYLENNILPQYYQEQQQQQQPSYNNYSMNGSVPTATSTEPAAVEPVSQMVSSSSSTSLTEKELLSILMNDGSVNFTPDEPENPEQKHKKFAGGSWSNSPHPSEIPKPNFK